MHRITPVTLAAISVLMASGFAQGVGQSTAGSMSAVYRSRALSLGSIPGVKVLPEPVRMQNGLELVATVDHRFDINAVVNTFNLEAGDTTNSEDIRPFGGRNLRGQGLTIGMWEVNRPLTTHQEFGGVGILPSGDGDIAPPIDTHATHVAATMSALGIDPAAQGMAPSAVVRPYTAANDAAELTTAAGLVASNHSYGLIRGWSQSTIANPVPERTWFADREFFNEDPGFGKYDATAVAIDTALHTNKRLLSVWSAGNDRSDNVNSYPAPFPGQYLTYLSQGGDGAGPNPAGWYRIGTANPTYPAPGQDGNNGAGYDSLPQGQTAKNSLVVGAIHEITAEGPNRTGAMSTFSSWGMTDDGRMGVTVVGNGVNVYSASGTANNAYATLNGTSMAAPNVTGTMTQVIQHLMAKRGTTTIPLSATSKALAVHTAHDLYNTGPDYQSGYGVLDGLAAVEFVDDVFDANPTSFIFEETYIDTRWSQEFLALGGEIKATLVWNDVAGVAHGGGLDINTSVLVNNLDLWIETTDMLTRFDPWSLDPTNPSAPASQSGANNLDNIEQVVSTFSLPPGTAFNVFVDLNGTLTGPGQEWSLLISGASLVPEPATLALLGGVAMLALRRRQSRDA
jgi:hypothetical protein